MSTKVRIKFLIFVLGVIGLVGGATLGFVLLTQFIHYFQQGADPASIFRGHKLIVPEKAQAQWLDSSAAAYINTPIKRAEREEIIVAYWEAWEALARARLTGNPADLPTYWAGEAYKQVATSLDADQPVILTHSGHKLALTFFSDDGSVVAFEDQDFTLEQQLSSGRDLPPPYKLRATATVVMTLDNGFWRIRVLVLNYRA